MSIVVQSLNTTVEMGSVVDNVRVEETLTTVGEDQIGAPMCASVDLVGLDKNNQ